MSEEIDNDDVVETPVSGRRDLLGKAAVAAAVTAVAGLSMSRTASAANGGNFIIGASNTGTATTALSGGSSLTVTNGFSASGGGAGGLGVLPGSIVAAQPAVGRAAIIGEATATDGVGVYGATNGSSGRGVYGKATGSNGDGVYGEHDNTSTSGNGVVGVSNFGFGVLAVGSVADVSAGGSGRVLLATAGVADPPVITSGTVGTVARDAGGNMWVCVVGGNPSSWRKLAGPATSGSLHLLAAPTRVYDSRVGAAPAIEPKTPLTNLVSRTVDCKGNSSGVPAAARGVLLNVTVITVTSGGFLAVTPGGAGFTGTSTLNWSSAGAVIANSATSACGAGATVDVTAGGGGTTDVLVDVFGYYL